MGQIIASTYELIKKIGAGGGGNVYLAMHLRLQKNVVLKMDKRKLATKQELLRREVDVLKELNHPYIPQVYDFFVEGENVCTVMDYIEGESLDKALKRGERFSQPQVIRWACQLLDALCYLHSPVHGNPPHGYVHSDIKPANLMRTLQGDICLIDFNIALALGEEDVLGCSAGYASPEHYGLDFSSRYESGYNSRMEERSATFGEDAVTVTLAGPSTGSMFSSSPKSSSSSMRRKTILPDVRSDIYSVGATLYHLLAGKRPSKNATEVAPLPRGQFSDQIVQIISKAMEPNPDLRYQTADEMKKDLEGLRENDPRMIRWRRQRRIAFALLPAAFLAGGALAFIGLKGMQMEENRLKRVEYSKAALSEGDVETARKESWQVLSESSAAFLQSYVPGAQAVLTEALGVYDLSDGYKFYKTIEFPSAPVYLALSPDGETGAALCGKEIYLFDTISAEVIAELPAAPLPILEIKFADKDIVLFSGEKGLEAYDMKGGRALWTGDMAASISISGDGKRVAGIDEGGTSATIYDAKTGEAVCKADFHGKRQSIGIKDNFFELNADGSLLGASFQDGSFQIFDLENPEKEMAIMGAGSGYVHFEGGFCGDSLAFGASGEEGSAFAILDVKTGKTSVESRSEIAFGVQADENGAYVQSGHILVQVDPVTGEQRPLVDMAGDILCFATDSGHTVVTSENELFFFDGDAQQISRYKKEYESDLLCIADRTALAGSKDKPAVSILQYREHPETEIFSYDPDYSHSEARVSADEETLMLFSYRGFRIYDKEGAVAADVFLPDPERVLDQQFVREEGGSYLKVAYDDGKVDVYSAQDGELLGQEKSERDSENLDEEFVLDELLIKSPLHGTPVVYDVETGKEIARLKEDTYLTDVAKEGDYLIARYVTAEGEAYGQLLDEACEVLAELPYLSDVLDGMLVFDYPAGSIRKTHIYELEELLGKGE